MWSADLTTTDILAIVFTTNRRKGFRSMCCLIWANCIFAPQNYSEHPKLLVNGQDTLRLLLTRYPLIGEPSGFFWRMLALLAQRKPFQRRRVKKAPAALKLCWPDPLVISETRHPAVKQGVCAAGLVTNNTRLKMKEFKYGQHRQFQQHQSDKLAGLHRHLYR
jgi:hypothetical protein